MRELSIRQWWLAEQLRVDRKTISRWLAGKVKRISAENLTNLAGILGCREDELTTQDPTDVFASIDDQTRAAKLIDEKALIETLAPSGQWELMEALIKAVMRPELPVYMLGQLYNNLSIAAWRQNKLPDAERNAQAALELGRRSDNKSVIANALLNLGTISGIAGRIEESISFYNQALSDLIYLDEPLERGKALSNLGTDYMDYGDFQLCIDYQVRAIDEFKDINPEPDMNIAIALTNMARSQLALGQAGALETAENAQRHAEHGKYLRGIAFCNLLLGEIAASAGRNDEAKRYIETGLSQFREQGIDEALNHLLAARVHRLAGEIKLAIDSVERGLIIGKNYPVYLADLHHESALINKSLNPAAASASLQTAIELFDHCGCRLMSEKCKSTARESGLAI